jgi:hypothetical protein
MKNQLFLISFLLIISGCAPYIITSNPRQVTIGNGGNSEAQEMADNECKKHERYGIHRPDNRRDGNTTYECME